MRPMVGRLIGSALTLLAAAQIAAARVEGTRVAQDEIASVVRVSDVDLVGDTVRARLDNLSNDRLENVRVIVGQSCRWKNERHPGPDDPSRADVLMVTDSIEPRSSIVITHTFSARPERADGWFQPSVEVVGLDRYGAEPAPAAPAFTTPAAPQ